MWETKQLQVPSDFQIIYVNLRLGDMSKNLYLRGFFGLSCGIWYVYLCFFVFGLNKQTNK